MNKLFLLLFLVGCASEEKLFVTAPLLPRATPDTTPYRHPSFVKDTTWNEDDVGMTLVYESKNFAQPWFHTIVSDTLEAVRKGWKAQRFEVRPGDCYSTDCTRSPVYERNEFAQAANENVEGDEYWYAWSFYVPANIPEASWVFMGQFQQRSNWDSIWMFMKRAGQPFCAIFDWRKNNHWDCSGSAGTYPLIDDSNFLGKWHDVLVHAKWTQQNNGFTEIYIDGELVVNYNGYTRTAGNHDVYFKYGIYRHGSNQTSVVYYDEIRRGKTRNEVDIRLLDK
jgi:hypothetical protein